VGRLATKPILSPPPPPPPPMTLYSPHYNDALDEHMSPFPSDPLNSTASNPPTSPDGGRWYNPPLAQDVAGRWGRGRAGLNTASVAPLPPLGPAGGRSRKEPTASIVPTIASSYSTSFNTSPLANAGGGVIRSGRERDFAPSRSPTTRDQE
jgi:hypothetical protein